MLAVRDRNTTKLELISIYFDENHHSDPIPVLHGKEEKNEQIKEILKGKKMEGGLESFEGGSNF